MFEKDIPPPHTHQEAGKKKKHGIITVPDKVGPYSIHETIGEGAFSIVKLSYHEEYCQHYACKIVPLKMLKEKNLYDRFELELRISQIMRNPGVATITDVLKDQNNFYIFMEYYPNGNLLNYIVSKTRLDEEEAKVLILQIFNSLEFVHKQKVCHRDLKPENVLIDQSGHLRISDFGLSRFVGEENLVKTPCGSPCYVSPECISGCCYDGLKSDIWSCGVILYAMVTGMLPWTKRKMNDLFKQITIGSFSVPKYVSSECSELIHSLMTVDPNERISLEDARKVKWFSVHPDIYSIPVSPSLSTLKAQSFQTKSPLMETHKPVFQGVPYLSIRKVDYYFRPDVKFRLHKVFKRIQNVHAIENLKTPEKSDVSSPQLTFEKVFNELQKTTDIPIKSRRNSLGAENVDPSYSLEISNSSLNKKVNRKKYTSLVNFQKKYLRNERINENENTIQNTSEMLKNPNFSLSIEDLQKRQKRQSALGN